MRDAFTYNTKYENSGNTAERVQLDQLIQRTVISRSSDKSNPEKRCRVFGQREVALS